MVLRLESPDTRIFKRLSFDELNEIIPAGSLLVDSGGTIRKEPSVVILLRSGRRYIVVGSSVFSSGIWLTNVGIDFLIMIRMVAVSVSIRFDRLYTGVSSWRIRIGIETAGDVGGTDSVLFKNVIRLPEMSIYLSLSTRTKVLSPVRLI